MTLSKKAILAAAVLIAAFIVVLQYKSVNNCQSTEERQERLEDIESLKSGVTIITETDAGTIEKRSKKDGEPGNSFE